MTDYERGYEQGKADATKKMHLEIRKFFEDYFDKCFASYREWIGLTDEEVVALQDFAYADDVEFVRHIEAKLKEKNK